MGVTADEIADVYARVKKHGRMGVDHAAWMKGAKFLRSLLSGLRVRGRGNSAPECAMSARDARGPGGVRADVFGCL